ncbi:MAG: hypothetical protein ACXVH6_06645 [Halobacteriota archaeon]
MREKADTTGYNSVPIGAIIASVPWCIELLAGDIALCNSILLSALALTEARGVVIY